MTENSADSMEPGINVTTREQVAVVPTTKDKEKDLEDYQSWLKLKEEVEDLEETEEGSKEHMAAKRALRKAKLSKEQKEFGERVLKADAACKAAFRPQKDAEEGIQKAKDELEAQRAKAVAESGRRHTLKVAS